MILGYVLGLLRRASTPVVRPTFDLTLGTLPAGLTLTRASTATVQTGTTAVTTGVAVDVARFGRRLDADTTGLVIEEARTSLVTVGRAMTGSGWAAASGGSYAAPGAGTNSPDATQNACSSSTTSGQYSKYFTRASVDGYVQMRFWAKAVSSVFTSTTQIGSPNQNYTIGTSWGEICAEYNAAATYYLTPFNAGGAVTQNAYFDMFDIQAGRFRTEWIPEGATRAADRLVCSSRLDDNGRLSLEMILRPKGDSTKYAASGYLLYIDASNYVLWSKTTYKITFRVGGTSYTPTTTVDFSAGDTLKIWLEAGGSLATRGAFAVNGAVGRIVTEGTETTLGTLTVTSCDLLGNNTANVFSCWLTNLTSYARGSRPAWVTACLGSNPGVAAAAFGGSWQSFTPGLSYTWGNDDDQSHAGVYRSYSECAMAVFETTSTVIRVTEYELYSSSDAEYVAAGVVVGAVGAVYGTAPATRVNIAGSTGSYTTEYTLPSGNKRVFVIGSALNGPYGQWIQSVAFDAAATTTQVSEPAQRSVCFESWGSKHLYDDGYKYTAGVLDAGGAAVAARAAFLVRLALFAPTELYFCAGTNDLSGGVVASDFELAVTKFYDDVKATLPGCTIRLQSIVRRPALEASTAPGFRTAVSNVATAKSATYVNGLSIFAAGDISADNVHPIASSAYLLANAVLANTTATSKLMVYGDSIVSGSTTNGTSQTGSWACVLGVPGLIRIGRIA